MYHLQSEHHAETAIQLNLMNFCHPYLLSVFIKYKLHSDSDYFGLN